MPQRNAPTPTRLSPGCWTGKSGGIRCNVTADSCMCSRGCSSSWSCQPSQQCQHVGAFAAASSYTPLAATSLPPRVAFTLFLTFNRSFVRGKYAKKPYMAYNREVKRVKWFLNSSLRVGTRVPIHVIVGPERFPDREAEIMRLGAKITPIPAWVPPPAFASSHHRLSFCKISALALTQFDKIFVFDNDMALVHNVDDLVFAPAPSAVWHTTVAKFQFKAKETCAVTTGLIGLVPSQREFARAVAYLASMPEKTSYDGGDQEFWRGFHRSPPWYELPLRYQAHQMLRMPPSEWARVHVLHAIAGLRGTSMLPRELRSYINYYT